MQARTILHGACLLHGQHPHGSIEARECPVLKGRITPEENARRAGRPKSYTSYTPPGASETAGMGEQPGIVSGGSSSLGISGGYDTAKAGQRDFFAPLARLRQRGGRVALSPEVKRQHERERKRRQRGAL